MKNKSSFIGKRTISNIDELPESDVQLAKRISTKASREVIDLIDSSPSESESSLPPPSSFNSSQTVPTSALWLDAFAPRSEADLCVHIKKLAELKEGLDRCVGSTSAIAPLRLLVLHGPSGCGKSSALRVVCESTGVSICEWSTPVGISYQAHRTLDVEYESRLDQFRSFMFRANRYASLDDSDVGKKIVLVDDAPYLADEDRKSHFFDTLRQSMSFGRYTTVLIVSGEDVRDVLPADLRNHPLTDVITFNPVAPTAVKKSLQRVCSLAKFTPSPNMLEWIVDSCNGDVRSAMNMLQFLAAKRGSFADVCRRDTDVEVSHAIGKILYSGVRSTTKTKKATKASGKARLLSSRSALTRVEDSSPFLDEFLEGDSMQSVDSFPAMSAPPSVPMVVTTREPLLQKYDIDSLITSTGTTASNFVLWLHQNCPEHYTEIDELSLALDSCSEADLCLTTSWEREFSLGSSCGAMIASLGSAIFNIHPAPSKFMPTRRPQTHDINRTATDFRASCMAAIEAGCTVSDALLLRAGSTELMTEVVPGACAATRLSPVDALKLVARGTQFASEAVKFHQEVVDDIVDD